MEIAQNGHQNKDRNYLSIKDRVANVIFPIIHEVRTPIASIVAAIGIIDDLLKDGRPQDIQEAREFIADILTTGNTLEEIYERFCKSVNANTPTISAFQAASDGEICSIKELLNKVGQMLTPIAAEKKITISNEVPKEMPLVVYCDTTYLLQVITNLVINAIKFSPQGARVKIKCNPSPDHSTFNISVEDTGPGIPPTEVERIFEAGYRVHSNEKGQGLGLSLVKDLLEILHGTIQVDSRLNAGSTFTVTLPLIPFY
ncbi:sensor histidine kinase [Chitinophaga tropicalis]|nr:HAMP domain-containing sensor histidine kinase [Chitinophaga tropicalis]